MANKTFEIQYRDPETGDWVTTLRNIIDTKDWPAEDVAEDLAYALADKGPYKIKELK